MLDRYIVLLKKKLVFSLSLFLFSFSFGVIILDVEMDIFCCLDCCRYGFRSTRCFFFRFGYSNESRVREIYYVIFSRRG